MSCSTSSSDLVEGRGNACSVKSHAAGLLREGRNIPPCSTSSPYVFLSRVKPHVPIPAEGLTATRPRRSSTHAGETGAARAGPWLRAGGAGATSQTWWPAATHKATDRLPLKSGAAGAGSCSVSTRAKTPGSESDNLNPSKPV